MSETQSTANVPPPEKSPAYSLELPPAFVANHYRYPDGSQVWGSYVHPGWWLANWADGGLVAGVAPQAGEPAVYFVISEDAVLALIAGGQGPAGAPKVDRGKKAGK